MALDVFALAIKVACPYCGALAGRRCRKRNGMGQTKKPHLQRIRASDKEGAPCD